MTASVTARNEAADLLEQLQLGPLDEGQYDHDAAVALLDAALRTERLRVVEQIRERFASFRGEQFGHAYWGDKLEIALTDAVAGLTGEEPTCSGCNGRRWTEDENWSPAYPETWRGERSPGDGLIPCGFCNLGGWNVPPGLTGEEPSDE